MMASRFCFGLLFAISYTVAQWPWHEPYVNSLPSFKDGLSIIDIRDYGCKGDGLFDNTACFTSAFNNTIEFRIIYIPAGNYTASAPLVFPGYKGGIESRIYLLGESVNSTVLHLAANSPAFQNTSAPQPFIRSGSSPAQNFFMSFQSFTVSLGPNNPGATGVALDTNNQGSLNNVSIVAAPSSMPPLAGVDLRFTGQIGPSLVKFVNVQGFKYGVWIATPVDSVTFEDLCFRNITTASIVNYGQTISIRRAISIGPQPLLLHSTAPNAALATLFDSVAINDNITTSITTSSTVAVNNTNGMLRIRNFTTSGFDLSISSAGWTSPPPVHDNCSLTYNNTTLHGGYLIKTLQDSDVTACCQACNDINANKTFCNAWTLVTDPSHDYLECSLWHCYSGVSHCNVQPSNTTELGIFNNTPPYFPSRTNITQPTVQSYLSHPIATLLKDDSIDPNGLNLPIKETPNRPIVSKWTLAFANSSNASIDCSPLLGRTLAAGAEHVYFSYRHDPWQFEGNVTIPPTTQLLYGAGVNVNGPSVWSVEGDQHDSPLFLEHFHGKRTQQITVLHNSQRPVVIRHTCTLKYQPNCNNGHVPGDLFLEDVCIAGLNLCNGQKVWARQLNTEIQRQLDLNLTGSGTSLWAFGWKIEGGAGGLVNMTEGSSFEAMSLFAYTTARPEPLIRPAFSVLNNSRLSVSFSEFNADNNPFQIIAREARDGQDVMLLHNDSRPGLLSSDGGHASVLMNLYKAQDDLAE
eukprot:TRINITY_DN11221_c0_g1_i1.p1 TRINITY_DN11221_c0_g1~~TRINITY_DN11221_c0_g1_i1.p1  ORF type:complete len:746 (+),score=77.24 TRINITY_DN11221_c0_g1_i1:2-2239(+)